MSKPNCAHESFTLRGKIYVCAGDGYYLTKDGDVWFTSKTGNANYQRDLLVGAYLKAAAATAVGVAVVHVLTK